MDTQSFLTEEDARSFAARALSGNKAEGPKPKQAAPVQFSPASIAKALNRKKQILAKSRAKA
ncbi:MAG TPA: hypothetical protein VEZ48_09815 [Sphingomonadaceae bacterium]|nr:hypothetical protein [Sphingomonadaceae bacterium]